MKNKSIQETSVSIILIALLVLIANPYNLWMPNMVHLMVLGGAVGVFGLFAAFIFKEKVADERESSHRMLSGRVAFLSGSALLVVGIIYQSLNDKLDIWLPFILVVMIITKLGTRFYSDKNY